MQTTPLNQKRVTFQTLYLCYFSLREPLVQTQVLPYLRELVKGGLGVHLLTFEPGWPGSWLPEEVQQWEERLAAGGIHWHARTYHRRPSLPATMYDIASGAWHVIRLARRERIAVLHARSHVAAMMGALAKPWTGAKLLFDIRGMLAEEYVDAGIWPAGGRLYRLTKAAERWLLHAADGFVVLTEKGQRLLFGERQVLSEVIPCCVDGARFPASLARQREQWRREFGFAGKRVLVYVGALGGWYLTDELIALLVEAHRQYPQTFSLILTQSPSEVLRERLLQQGLSCEQFLIRSVPVPEVPRYLVAADLAVSLIKPCYSKQFSSPTKVAEYLAAGLPVLCNAGIGDLDELIERERVGLLFAEFTPQALRAALKRVEQLLAEPDLAQRCRSVALQHFDLAQVGGARYRQLYQRLLQSPHVG